MTNRNIPTGPEPVYDRVVSGYETFHSAQPFVCEWGGVLPEINLAYESWGERSTSGDNCILIHTGLSASSHARSHPRNPSPGWWEDFIGMYGRLGFALGADYPHTELLRALRDDVTDGSHPQNTASFPFK